MGLIAMSERDLQRIEILSKVVAPFTVAARQSAGGRDRTMSGRHDVGRVAASEGSMPIRRPRWAP